MRGKSVYKIPDGKLVKVSLEFENNFVRKIKVHGDFFLYPETGIEKIEESLNGKKIDEDELILCINKAVEKNGLELFGLSAEGLAKAILIAKESVAKND